jgi:hypothetical protein
MLLNSGRVSCLLEKLTTALSRKQIGTYPDRGEVAAPSVLPGLGTRNWCQQNLAH